MSEEFPADAGGVLAGLGAGSRVGGYLLERQVGAGGMAVVFRARDERLGRRVALKVLAAALAADAGFRQRFLRESRAAAAVDDPHIIPVFEAGDAGGVLFIAMRYVPGGDVRTLLHQQGPLSPDRAAAIISPVASALDAAHAAGLVHRDVKPANMLVDARPGLPDHVYLSDFGLSKGTLSSAGLTGTGQYLGTPDYMAPEQIEGRAVDGRTDQYALACAAFELLCGEPPFQRDQGMAVLFAHLQQPPPSLSARRPGLPAAVDAVFARALAKAPEDRYGACGELAEALRAALGLPPYDAGSAGGPPRRTPTQVAVLPTVTRAPVPPATGPEPDPGQLTAGPAPHQAPEPEPGQPTAGPAPGQAPEPGPEPEQPAAGPAPDETAVSGPEQARGWRPSRRVSVTAAAGAALAAAVIIAAVIGLGSTPAGHPSTPAGHPSAPADLTARPATAYVLTNSTVMPVDVATGVAGTQIQVRDWSQAIAITPDGKTAYVTSGITDGSATNEGMVTPIDLATGRVGTPIPVGSDPVAIVITPDGKTAYVANSVSGTVTPIDLATGRAGTPIPVGNGGPEAIAVTPDGKTVWVTSQVNEVSNGTLTPIDVATGRAGSPIQVGVYPAAIAITPDGKTAYVTNVESGTVTPIDLATGQAGTPIQFGNVSPQGIAITPDGQTAYVTTQGPVTPIDLATGRVGTPLHGVNGSLLAITPDGKTAYVTSENGVTPIDLATGRAGTPIQVGNGGAEAIAITP